MKRILCSLLVATLPFGTLEVGGPGLFRSRGTSVANSRVKSDKRTVVALTMHTLSSYVLQGSIVMQAHHFAPASGVADMNGVFQIEVLGHRREVVGVVVEVVAVG